MISETLYYVALYGLLVIAAGCLGWMFRSKKAKPRDTNVPMAQVSSIRVPLSNRMLFAVCCAALIVVVAMDITSYRILLLEGSKGAVTWSYRRSFSKPVVTTAEVSADRLLTVMNRSSELVRLQSVSYGAYVGDEVELIDSQTVVSVTEVNYVGPNDVPPSTISSSHGIPKRKKWLTWGDGDMLVSPRQAMAEFAEIAATKAEADRLAAEESQSISSFAEYQLEIAGKRIDIFEGAQPQPIVFVDDETGKQLTIAPTRTPLWTYDGMSFYFDYPSEYTFTKISDSVVVHSLGGNSVTVLGDGHSLESLVQQFGQSGVELKPTAMKMGRLLVDGFAGESADGVKTELGSRTINESTTVFWIVQSRQLTDEQEHLQLANVVSSLRSITDAVVLPRFEIRVRDGSGPQQSYEAHLRQRISAFGVDMSVQLRTKALQIPVKGKPGALTYYPRTDGATIRRRAWDLDFEHAPQFRLSALAVDEHTIVLQGTLVQIGLWQKSDGAATDADFDKSELVAGSIGRSSRQFAGKKTIGKTVTCGASALDTCELYSFPVSFDAKPDSPHLIVQLRYTTTDRKAVASSFHEIRQVVESVVASSRGENVVSEVGR